MASPHALQTLRRGLYRTGGPDLILEGTDRSPAAEFVDVAMLSASGIAVEEVVWPEASAGLRHESSIDAVLVCEVRPQFASAAERAFVLRWQLVDAIDQRRLWAGQAVTGPDRVVDRRLSCPRGSYQDGAIDDPFLSDEQVPSRELGGATRSVRTRTIREQADDAQVRVAERLPYGDS